MSNKRYWDKLARPPASALKTIKGGRLSGKSDINPQWRMEAMTDVFGPVGVGWKYTIDKLWTEPGQGSEVMAFALVSVQFRDGDDWSEPITGVGGNSLVTQERAGLYSNDEAFKMAVTDALSTALKAIGVAADIYAGLWDGSKYHDRPEEPKVSETDQKKIEGALTEISMAQSLEELNAIGQTLATFPKSISDACRKAYSARLNALRMEQTA